uniref:SOSS complex subunit C n=1 Tax=Oncorhynchus mykiss TaxID=8022 RepID=A0A8L0DTJ4_ONCMY
ASGQNSKVVHVLYREYGAIWDAYLDSVTRVTPDLYPPIPLSRPVLNKAFRDHTEQQHIAAQQEAALQHAHTHSSGFFITQDSSFGNLILPVLPQPDPPPAAELQNL